MLKIKIKSEGKRFSLRVPYFLGGVALKFANVKLSREEKVLMKKAYKVLKKEVKNYKGLTVLEVNSKDGEHVSITL